MAEPVRVISSMATRALLVDLVERWVANGGAPVTCESIGGVDAAKRVAAGAVYDIVVLAEDAIDRLVAAGHAIAETKANLVRSSVAIAVRRGDVHPSVGDERALKIAVGNARRIAVSTGPSGHAIRQRLADWGMASDLDGRLVQAPPGIPVGKLIAEGAADLGFQQLSELQGLPGIEVLGLMPRGLEVVTTFSGACCSVAPHREEASAILRFWNSSEVSALKTMHGMAPASA